MEITFKCDKTGRKRAYRFSRSQMRWFPMLLAQAEHMVAEGKARFIPITKACLKPGN